MIDNIELYKRFLVVAESKSISAAALSMHISQPALSSDIGELEKKLNTKLFFRTNRGISLTQEGEILFDYIKRALSSIQTGEDIINEITGLKRGVMRIGASDMTLRFFLLDYLEIFRNKYPEVKLKVTNAPTPQTLSALRNGEIDFGVITESTLDNSGTNKEYGGDICIIPVCEIHDIFICSDKYPIAGKKNAEISELSEYTVIMLEESTSTRRYVQSVIGKENLTPDIELATSDLLLEFAIRGIGISSIVENFAESAIESGKVKKIDLSAPIPPRHICIAYLKNVPLCTSAKEMLKLMNIK